MDERLTLRDQRNTAVSILEGVSFLVQAGYSEQFVLDEINIDTFKDLVLVSQKLRTMHYWNIGMAFTSALASVLSKDGAAKTQEAMDTILNKIDTALLGEDNGEEDEDLTVTTTRRRRTPKAPEKLERMLRQFHQNFSAASGTKLPTYDSAVKQSTREQKAGLPPE